MATPQSPQHTRNISGRSYRPRAATKGPLDMPDDDILSPQGSLSPQSPQKSQIRTSAHLARDSTESPSSSGPLDQFDSLRIELDSILATKDIHPVTKDLSFLLRPEMYHPLSQLEVPPMFRSAFYHPPTEEPLTASMSTLNTLLGQGHFLLAAHLCGTLLVSPSIAPTDTKTIFTLLYTRLACLELTGNTAFAAQESKALEDLSSAFYYVDTDLEASADGKVRDPGVPSYHIVPWPLRVLAVRLQSIGFGDARRSVAGLYELGLDARRQIMRPGVEHTQKQIWKERLADLGIRSVNALIEMGDLDAARRSLASLKGGSSDSDTLRMRKTLLHLRIGDVGAAKDTVKESETLEESALKPLIAMAEGRYDEAVTEWRSLLENNSSKSIGPVLVQNLAVCLLYTGQLAESRSLLESLISANHSFQSLTFNLSTIYELCSDKSRNLKLRLAEVVSKQAHSGETNVDRANADFKL